MKVKIGGLELSDITLDELDELVRRYGNASGGGEHGDATPPKASNGAAVPVSGAAADTVVLQKLVEAGTDGVKATSLGTILGKKGKATRGAVREWAKRVGVSSDDDPIEDCRTDGTARGIRLKAALIDVAKAILAERRK
jgi:hypothetical protein